MGLTNLVRAATFAATAIGLGFMFMLVPNIEFISVTVFLSGLTLGVLFGTLVGGTAMLIYSILNPLGSGLIYIPLLVGQIIAMAGIGTAGAIMGKLFKSMPFRISIPAAGVSGCISALWYDGITTLAYPFSAGYNWDETLTYAVSGLIFTFMHAVSNTVIFSIVVPGYLKRLSP
jgi:hypothetical protein